MERGVVAMNLREHTEELERQTLSSRACLSSQSRGRNGSYSQNFQQAGRDMP